MGREHQLSGAEGEKRRKEGRRTKSDHEGGKTDGRGWPRSTGEKYVRGRAANKVQDIEINKTRKSIQGTKYTEKVLPALMIELTLFPLTRSHFVLSFLLPVDCFPSLITSASPCLSASPSLSFNCLPQGLFTPLPLLSRAHALSFFFRCVPSLTWAERVHMTLWIRKGHAMIDILEEIRTEVMLVATTTTRSFSLLSTTAQQSFSLSPSLSLSFFFFFFF